MSRIIVFLLALSFLSATEPPISLDIMPKVGMAPLTLRVRITIPRDEHNRMACLAYDSMSYSGSSCWQVDGMDAPRTTTKLVKDLPVGKYAFQAYVTRNDNIKPALTTMVDVIALGPD